MKHLLQDARAEILSLRRENEILRAKVEMIDLFACILFTKAAQSNQGGMAPDVAWELQKKIDDLAKRDEMNDVPEAAEIIKRGPAP